jgi:acyl-CoA thioesterase FadM
MSIISVTKYRKEYVVKTYEADAHGVLRIVTLMNVLQDIAVEHADSLGFGFKECMKKGIVWVGANYLIDI